MRKVAPKKATTPHWIVETLKEMRDRAEDAKIRAYRNLQRTADRPDLHDAAMIDERDWHRHLQDICRLLEGMRGDDRTGQPPLSFA